MKEQRRELRREKRIEADHNRALNRVHRLKTLAAGITNEAMLETAFRGFSAAERFELTEEIRPYLTFALTGQDGRSSSDDGR